MKTSIRLFLVSFFCLVVTAVYQIGMNENMPISAGFMSIGLFFLGASFATSYAMQDDWLFPIKKKAEVKA